MATEADKLKLGMFLIGGIAILVLGLIAFGSGRLFARPLHIVTFFDESVQGLEVGAAVKWRGVRVGRVSRILLRSDARLVRVDMEIDRRRFIGTAKTRKPLPKVIREKIAEGLRSQLELTGITGMKDVEFDYFTDKQCRNQVGPLNLPGELCIPSIPSEFAQLQKSVSDTVQRISAVDFEGISNRLTRVLNNLDRIVADPAIRESICNIQQASRSFARLGARIDKYADPEMVRKVRDNLKTVSDNLAKLSNIMIRTIEDPAMHRAFTDFQTAAGHFRALTERLDADAQKAKLPELIHNAGGTLDEARRTAVSARRLGDRLTLTLGQLDQTLIALRRLIQQIQAAPSMLLRGRKLTRKEK